MQIIYLGKYNKRFTPIINSINQDSKIIVELCFGDLKIANYCKRTGIKWIGYDLNSGFVLNALKHGHEAFCNDILSIEKLPDSDTIIIIGSLYHFHKNLDMLFEKIVNSTKQIIISEPIKNISSMKGIIGFIAKKAANAGKGDESFRFDKKTFLDAIENNYYFKNKFDLNIINIKRDIVITLLPINNDK